MATTKSMKVNSKRDGSLNQPGSQSTKPQIGVKGIAALSDLRNSRGQSNLRKFTTESVTTPVGGELGRLKDGSKNNLVKPPIQGIVTTSKKKMPSKSTTVKSPLNCANKLMKVGSKGKTIDGSNQIITEKTQ